MRKITLIVIHCSAVKPEQTSSAKQIDSWHKGQGWKCIGYHYVVWRPLSIGRPNVLKIEAKMENKNGSLAKIRGYVLTNLKRKTRYHSRNFHFNFERSDHDFT